MINEEKDKLDNYYLLTKDDVKKMFPKRDSFTNKGDYGYVGIIGGCSKYLGAVQLASLGQNALYVGCGVSRIIIPDCIKEIIYNHVLEATVYPIKSQDGFMVFNKEEIDSSLRGLKAVAIGMGWGISLENQKILEYILKTYTGRLIIDADGLNNLVDIGLDILNESKAKIVLTPHLKEFSRLTNYSIEYIQNNSIAVANEFVNKYNVTLLLKGPTTIVTDKKEHYLVNRGTPGMAKAGSGDVLSGILVGLCGFSKNTLPFIAASGAYINGLAGEIATEKFTEYSMVSSDTAREVTEAIRRIIL